MNLFITNMGHQTIKTKNSYEAITFTEAEGPNLILMDMQLPDVDGVKTTASSREPWRSPHSSSWLVIEMKMDSAATIHDFRRHSLGVLANQKARESDDGLFIGEKRVFGRPPTGKFHELAIVVNVHVEIEFVETDLGLGLAFNET